MDLFYDLHIHSCLSPCGDDEMTPYNLVNMAKLLGFDLIALTDHNTAGNCRAAMLAGKQAQITVVPGMELCTAEEVHMVCLFPDIERAEAFSDFVRTTLPPVRNRPDIFGRQLYRNESDEISGEEEILLLTASSLTLGQAAAAVREGGGFCFPAHIDRDSYSVLSNLGAIDPSFGFTVAEVYEKTQREPLSRRHPILRTMRLLSDSDAHSLEKMREPDEKLSLPENTPQALLALLRQELQD